MVVEDEYFIAKELVAALEERGAVVVGPVSNVRDAIELVERSERIDAGVLDVNLQGEMVYPVAEALRRRGVRFVFATGYDASSIEKTYRDVARYEKPVEPDKLVQAMLG